jgi:predicted transcriptional regulator
MTIREAARRMERDVKGVHADVQTLLAAGLLRKTDDGRIVFPYDTIRVNLTLRAA